MKTYQYLLSEENVCIPLLKFKRLYVKTSQLLIIQLKNGCIQRAVPAICSCFLMMISGMV